MDRIDRMINLYKIRVGWKMVCLGTENHPVNPVYPV
jgi:hypothetical protein